jgi:hypothetical protein
MHWVSTALMHWHPQKDPTQPPWSPHLQVLLAHVGVCRAHGQPGPQQLPRLAIHVEIAHVNQLAAAVVRQRQHGHLHVVHRVRDARDADPPLR